MRLTSRNIIIVLAISLSISAASGTELHNAIESGDVGNVMRIMAADSSVIAVTDEAGNTPLHLACRSGSVEIANLLIDAGADINAVNSQGMTPLRTAIHARRADVAVLLLDKGAGTDDIHPMFGSLPDQAFAGACQNNTGPEMLELLMAHGLEFDASRVDALANDSLRAGARCGS